MKVTPAEFVRIGRLITTFVGEGQREGQATFNALHTVRPDIADDVLRSSKELDPFYHDDRLEAFWAYVIAHGAEDLPAGMVNVVFDGLYADDHMTIQNFVNAVVDGVFIDYDGYGCFATATQFQPGAIILPSHVAVVREDDGSIIDKSIIHPTWATHIVWFNK